jgi:hypothetical protein
MSIFCDMETLTARKKPGPRPKGYVRQQAFLPKDIAEWAKDHPEGYSGLVRRLLTEEYYRQQHEKQT